SVGELFDLAAAMERAAEALYRAFARKFAHEEEIAAFWQSYADEEAAHAHWLEALKGRLSPDILARETNGEMLQAAKDALDVALDDLLGRIHNLDDAYELANEMESGETNAIFEFLIEEYEVAKESQRFLKAQLKQHVLKVGLGFPAQYNGKANRLVVKARM
ncbi:MAG: hypothetical protein JXD18_00375, partial [Anaerolineae bacterium]|nr:hypothetical protein [Anaerolineae bacterium]